MAYHAFSEGSVVITPVMRGGKNLFLSGVDVFCLLMGYGIKFNNI